MVVTSRSIVSEGEEVANIQGESQRRETHLFTLEIQKVLKGVREVSGVPGGQGYKHSLPKGWPACCRGPGGRGLLMPPGVLCQSCAMC